MAEDRSEQLGTDSISKLIIRFSGPAIIGMLVSALYNIVDKIYVGHIGGEVGELALAALQVCNPIMLIILAFSMLIAVGGAAAISLALGRGKKKEAERIIGNGITLTVILSVILTIIFFIFKRPLLMLFGASDNTFSYADSYISIILIGTVVNNLGFSLNRFLLSQGFSNISMYTMLIGAGVNIILDPIFIFGLKMEVSGAAAATVISQACSAAWVAYYFISGKSPLKIRRIYLIPKIKIALKIISIGMAPFFLQIAASIVQVILNPTLFRYGGDTALKAMSIIMAVSQVFLMPIFGINQGVQPIIGYNYGAKHYGRVKKALKISIVFATVVITLGWISIMLASQFYVRLFGSSSDEILQVGGKGLRLYLLLLPVVGMQVICANYFQCTGRPVRAMVLSLSRQVLLLIPSILILPIFFGLNGAFASGAVADGVASIITFVFILIEIKHLNRNIQGEQIDKTEEECYSA